MTSVIFCGGFGTRMNNGEPGQLKPLIPVAGKEILRHIISVYEHYGITNFLLLGGYRIDDLKAFAQKYTNDTLKIKVVDTGEGTPTGGRLLLAKNEIGEGAFMLTYGDSLTNFNLEKCIAHKKERGADLVVSTYRKFIEYGILDIDEDARLNGIFEKTYSVPINAGFYILDSRIFSFIQSENESFEIDVLPRILQDKTIHVSTFQVNFWHPMDTPDDQKKLEKILVNNPAILFE